MSVRFILILISVVGLTQFAGAEDAHVDEAIVTDDNLVESKLLLVKVYYEALCGDSMQFIRSQLYNSMMDNNRLQYTDLQFVPYGKVTTWTDPRDDVTTLHCQHGKRECELNAMHACIVDHNSVEEQLKMINCLMGGFRTNVDKCASNLNIDVSAAKHCKATRSVYDILKKYGEETTAIDISFVPSVAIEEFNRREQQKILYDFDNVFCMKYKEKYGVQLENCYNNN